MSLRCLSSSRGLIAFGFNQDATCIVASLQSGLKIFELSNLTLIKTLDQLGTISTASMLYCTSLLAFSGTGGDQSLSPRRALLFNSHSNEIIQTLAFPSTVLALHLNQKHLVVVLESKVNVYAIESVQLVSTLSTTQNPKGIAALTLTTQPEYLALPAHSSKGIISVQDVTHGKLGSVLEIEAHQSPLSLLCWSANSQFLASASVKGTVVRVFSMPQGTKMFTFRRGSTPARITGMAFTPPSRSTPLLAVASDHGSIHIYRLSPVDATQTAKSVAKAVMSAVRKNAPPMGNGEKILKIELNHCPKGTVTTCAWREREGAREGDDRLVVATSEGILYEYSIMDVKGYAPRATFEHNAVFV